MSTTIESIYGKVWTISGSEAEDGEVAIDPRGDAGNRLFKVADLLAALKAEGLLDGEMVMPVAVEMDSSGILRPVVGYLGASNDSSQYCEWAASLSLGRALYWRKKESEDQLASIRERALVQRRDDLAKELSTCGYDYLGAAPILRKAIDRIVELEDKVNAA